MLNKQSGLLGVSGLSNDMRELLEEEAEQGDRARPARHRHLLPTGCASTSAPTLAAMGGVDAVVFTGGIGENAPAHPRAHLPPGSSASACAWTRRTQRSASGGARHVSADGSPVARAAWSRPTRSC